MSKQQPTDKSAFLLGVILAKLDACRHAPATVNIDEIIRMIEDHFNHIA